MTASHLRSELQSSRDGLFALLRGLSEEQFRYAPAPGEWNIAAHLTHLLRTERIFAERAALALREHEPPVASTRISNDDDPGIAQHLAVPQVIHGLQACRRDLVAVLDAGDAVLDRAIVHERIGRMTITAIMEKMAAHEREHAADVARLASQAAAASRVALPLTERPQGGAR